MRPGHILRLGVLLAALIFLRGCYRPDWPAHPVSVRSDGNEPVSFEWRPEGKSGPCFVESCRNGVKRVFYIDTNNDGRFDQVTDLDSLDPNQIRWVIILLDGIPYRLFNDLYNEGHFRLFYPPARYISTFPSITDISFSTMLGIPGTSCYESAVFDRAQNKIHNGVGAYLNPGNELWSTAVDYRQNPMLDGPAYLWPRTIGHHEFYWMFRTARGILQKEPDRRHILIYAMSTDAMDHKGPWSEARLMLLEVEQYIERLVYSQQGRIGLVILADHGNNFMARTKLIPLDQNLQKAGLRPRFKDGFERAGDVVVPRFGLISLISAYTQNEADKKKVIDVMLSTPGVEHVMWNESNSVYVAHTGGEMAEIYRHAETTDSGTVEYFAYRCLQGDPLYLQPLLEKINKHHFGDDGLVYYESSELMFATGLHTWPCPLWRIWHGMNDFTAVAPDVVGSLDLGWFYGDPEMVRWEDLNGTHGGLRDLDTMSFFTSNMFQPASIMRVTDALPMINNFTGFVPQVGDPNKHGLGQYGMEASPAAHWPLTGYRNGTAPRWMPASHPASAPATQIAPAVELVPVKVESVPEANLPLPSLAPLPAPPQAPIAPTGARRAAAMMTLADVPPAPTASGPSPASTPATSARPRSARGRATSSGPFIPPSGMNPFTVEGETTRPAARPPASKPAAAAGGPTSQPAPMIPPIISPPATPPFVTPPTQPRAASQPPPISQPATSLPAANSQPQIPPVVPIEPPPSEASPEYWPADHMERPRTPQSQPAGQGPAQMPSMSTQPAGKTAAQIRPNGEMEAQTQPAGMLTAATQPTSQPSNEQPSSAPPPNAPPTSAEPAGEPLPVPPLPVPDESESADQTGRCGHPR